MATNYDKFIFRPVHAFGHDWDEFIEALEKSDLEKDESPDGWSQILHPRTTLFRSKHEGPFDIVTVELTWSGDGKYGPWQRDLRFRKAKCRTCGRAMVVNNTVECNYCERDRRRQLSAARSRRYRYRHGIVQLRSFQSCPVCGKEFLPKRSTARFCSTTCRVKDHRLKT